MEVEETPVPLAELPANPSLRVLNDRFPLAVWTERLKGFSHYNYVIDGITRGFSIGVDPQKVVDPSRISAADRRTCMTTVQEEAITEWVRKGLKKRFIVGPFDLDYKFSFGQLYLAPLFVIPKPNGTWRTIVHLSFKLSQYLYTINELLYPHMKTVQYIRFKEVVELVNRAGKGAWLFLIDAQDAYYRVPIHPSDWKYMGIRQILGIS